MSDWEVSALAREIQEKLKKSYEGGQRIFRAKILMIVSKHRASINRRKNLPEKTKAGMLYILETLFQEIVAIKLSVASAKKGGKKRDRPRGKIR